VDLFLEKDFDRVFLRLDKKCASGLSILCQRSASVSLKTQKNFFHATKRALVTFRGLALEKKCLNARAKMTNLIHSQK